MPPPPPKKINPLVEKIFFHEKSLGNDIPCKLSKSEVLQSIPKLLRGREMLSVLGVQIGLKMDV